MTQAKRKEAGTARGRGEQKKKKKEMREHDDKVKKNKTPMRDERLTQETTVQ